MTASKPLHGWRILVTRPEGQAHTLAQRLRSLGAQPLLLPVMRILPPEDWSAVDDALRRASAFDWIVFTSVNGVRYGMERLGALGFTPDSLSTVRIAVVGPATARAVQRWGLKPAALPLEFRTEAIADALGDVEGQRILLLRAEGARQALVHILKERGAQVTEVGVYRVLPVSDGRGVERLLSPVPDLVTLTSPSTARALAALVRSLPFPLPLERLPAVCIGPVTAAAAREEGFPVVGTARRYVEEGLVEAVLEAVQRLKPPIWWTEVGYDPGHQ
ncbi:MAG: uroporphyrinogen-III synthase [Dehalococcoidia bacterium]|nr:uroporphyrinogen-III synthase [Dehalococcoidia bacterium]MDW8119324.1 uroporphyrinogen-III synthase [Chloroflexota bacterium]